MKLAFLLLALILVPLSAGFSGCVTIPGEPVPTPVPYTDLSQLAVPRDEAGFTVASMTAKTASGSEMGFLSGTGIEKGYGEIFADTEEDYKATHLLVQIIAEVPEGRKPEEVFAAAASNLKGEIAREGAFVPLPDPGIGDQSIAAGGYQISSTVNTPAVVVMFRKGRILEVFVQMSSPPDINGTLKIARNAAARIPGAP